MWAGWFGLRSIVSTWPGEPTRKSEMQFLISAFLSSTAPAAFIRRKSGRLSPTSPAAPAWRKLRRVGPPQVGRLTFPMCNMESPPCPLSPVHSPLLETGDSFPTVDGGQWTLDDSDRVTHLVRDIYELAVILDAEAFVFPHLQHDFILAGCLVGVFVAGVGAGRHRGDDLAVTA